MPNNTLPAPSQYKGVMVSSTFTDLKEPRAALIKAIDRQGMKAIVMENDSAKPAGDVIESSLQMVRDSSAYVVVISHKYGQIPECPVRNPERLSLTELEFNEARRLNRPVLLFIMGENYPVVIQGVEIDPEKRKKLAAFRENAKQLTTHSLVPRIYKVFNNLHEFEVEATHSVADLRRELDRQDNDPSPNYAPGLFGPDPIPRPPAFYAVPDYIGSHQFVGRESQLASLNEWALPADAHPVMLFEAIGGTGKSMLAWQWITQYAIKVRSDWAGRFWYSFYERGGATADFCRHALGYITGRPVEEFLKQKAVELHEQLRHHLRSCPWLLVLDGLERVLVAYHRFDAAQLDDAEAGATDTILQRDPFAAIRPEDDDLLRTLAGAAPSKLLLTSRLTPRVLLNPASQPIPGVLREPLRGLRPVDAEVLLRSCGVKGNSQDIQDYLKRHCDCHPLVTGILAGLINDYLPDRGNFGAWSADPAWSGQLNLAHLNLVQKRNHILHAAIAALPDQSRQLLCTLALLSEAVDYHTLSALNPHLPPPPEEVEIPVNPENDWLWTHRSGVEKEKARQAYHAELQRRAEYERAVDAYRRSPASVTAIMQLRTTIRDLECRGLLQYDGQSKRYDLHPVVRGVAAGYLRQEEKVRYGQRLVDHFSRQPHKPSAEVDTLEDVRADLHVVRTLLQMGRHEQAFVAYQGDLSSVLFFNLEAYPEVVSLLRPFFPQGWSALPIGVDESASCYLASDAAIALERSGELRDALKMYGVALSSGIRREDWKTIQTQLTNISITLSKQNRLAKEELCTLFALDLAVLLGDEAELFRARLNRFRQLGEIGRWEDAEAMWQLVDPMGRDWPRGLYRPGQAEFTYVLVHFYKGDANKQDLAGAEQLAGAARNRGTIRDVHSLQGTWQLDQGQWDLAAESLHEAVRMAREVGQTDTASETQLTLAKFHLRQLPEPHHEAEQLAKARILDHGALANLWLALGDREQAKKQAIAAYHWGWADGEPYVRRYHLNKARALLEQLGVEVPNLPPYDPGVDGKVPWEDEVAAAIDKLRGEKRRKPKDEETKAVKHGHRQPG
jgi:hypothetical protein